MPKKTEAQTRQQIIDQCLKKAGWDVNDPSQVTSEIFLLRNTCSLQE